MAGPFEASIIIPVLNEGQRLRTAVDAVLRQRCRGPFEVLVVDGGSDDGCCEALRDTPGVRVFDAPGSSPGGARNLGARKARGRVLVFTDADCLPQEGWLEGLLAALDEQPRWAGVGGGLRHRWSGLPGALEDLDTRAHYQGLITSNVAYRPAAFHHVGGFDASLRCAEDWDLAWRLEEAGYPLGHDPAPMVVHAPCEDEDYVRFVRKQVWYARHDMPALLGHVLRRRSPPGTGVAHAEAGRFLRPALFHAATTALMASLVLAPLGAFLVLAWASAKVVHTAVRLPAARPLVGALLPHYIVKSLARGLGTWIGLVEYVWSEHRTVPRETPWPRATLRAPALSRPGFPAPVAETKPEHERVDAGEPLQGTAP